MKKLSIVFVLGMMLALSRPASADNKPTNFPDCVKHELSNGAMICGFTNLDDWKKVLKADVELTAKKKLLDLERRKSAQLAAQLIDYMGQLKAYQEIVSIQKDRNIELTKDVLDTDRKYQLERVKPRWGSAAAWTTAAVLAAVLSGFVANDVL